LVCPVCSTENPAGSKFCAECGTPFSFACTNCGAELRGGSKFCNECGTPVGSTPPAPAPVATPAARPLASVPGPAASTGSSPASERRLVSVLFADLVGFTQLSEQRDSEEVRELLTRYFDACRQLITRYGGTVEKFIGDAVMAVWGTPLAREDDAELAVRAAIELTQAVEALGESVGAPGLQARAGVLTGEAAVNRGAEGQGMVAGDMVNTAARIQSAAPQGGVLVGESTRRASETSIAYEDVGLFELKGKAEPVPLWRALRVVAARGGTMRWAGADVPFIGRDRELRTLKELFHASAETRKAHLVSVTGAAGTGKARLAWEFQKYIDGLAEKTRWFRGRCLAYGEGVTYWALAEMVRAHAEIVEGEEQSSALAKLRKTLEKGIPDAEERGWVEPRLAHLLGLDERGGRDREELFSAWRLFFERLADRYPTILLFEDLEWADAGLLDFIEYLLDWSKNYPLFVITLARPDIVERRSGWGAARRNFTSMYLEPLGDATMRELLAGLVPGLPEELATKILNRAEGVPVYAVETVRMLIDRGALVEEGSGYRVVGDVEDLEVPETLHALIAARLDGLSSEERSLVQNASVLGKTFTKRAIGSLSRLPDDELEQLVTTLVRKELLTVQTDPRSPERGQYGFIQELVKRVAYEMLSKKDRKARHLAAAEYLESSWGSEEGEIVEIVASHYLDAYRSAPDAGDAPEIAGKARGMLARAGEHAASLAANEEAQRYFDQAVELTEEPAGQAELLERAGQMAWAGAREEQATERYARAISLFESAGQARAAARVSARMAELELASGHIGQAIERMEQAFEVLSTGEPDPDIAGLAAQLARVLYFKGEIDLAAERLDAGLQIAEALWLPEVLSQGLNTKGLIACTRERVEEGVGLIKHALEVALANDLPSAAIRAYNNLAFWTGGLDRHEEELRYEQDGLELARRIGNRQWERTLTTGHLPPLAFLGRWDETLAMVSELIGGEGQIEAVRIASDLTFPMIVHLARGDLAEAERLMSALESAEGSELIQDILGIEYCRAALLRVKGDYRSALAAAERGFEMRSELGIAHQTVKEAFVEAIEAALALGNLAKAEAFVDVIDSKLRGRFPPYLLAHQARFRARIAHARGMTEGVDSGFKAAAGMFRELSMPFWLAVTMSEHAEWLAGIGRVADAEPLLSEAAFIFERLKASPWLERVSRIAPAGVAVAAP
jgi:class 3 adenylate cyclase/tetratricopeptide (TPR) repeat protein